MQRSTQRLVLVIVIIVSAVGVAGLLSQMKPEPPQKESEKRELLVDVMQLESMEASFSIRSQGTVRPLTQTILSAEVSGSIVSISPKFTAGGVFAKGEELMRIDATNYSVAVKRAEALVAQRQIEYDGARKLRSQGYRAEAELASAATALAAAQEDLIGAQRNLERTHIRLPYEGMVLSKEADLGQFVNPGTRLGITFATDVAEIRLPLTDHDLAFIALPAAADISKTGSIPGPSVKLSAIQKGQLVGWEARIVRSEGVVDENSRVTYAVAQINDPYQLHANGVALPIGTFVAAEIEGTTVAEIIRIPRSALRGSDQVLFIDDDNKLQIRSVDIVRADAQHAYIGGGASVGERISLTAIEAPSTGMLVRTTDRPDPEPVEDDKPTSQNEED